MLTSVLSAGLVGIHAVPVGVEVDVGSRGLPHFSVVGLPDAAVKESRDRVRAALKNTGMNFPLKPITVNLAPADLKKEGSSFDLPIAVGLAASEGVLSGRSLNGFVMAGELSLDGSIKSIRGALCMGMMAKKLGLSLILPVSNAAEAALVEGVKSYGVRSLPELVGFLRGEIKIEPSESGAAMDGIVAALYEEDFSEVRGQELAKRALEVAAAGGHNVLMIGPPGAGKTMLSRRLPGILPPITFHEAIETTMIHSIAGILKDDRPLVAARPFRSPHHTISDVALIGGGQNPKPGEVSISHNGVLFLDELPEFKRSALEVLRQPIEDSEVSISRAVGSVTYPASFMLVAAMNPCPCGYFGDGRHVCGCTPNAIHRYRSRISGPLLDRFDIHLDVPAVAYKELSAADYASESSSAIRTRVTSAREVQLKRFKGDGVFSNGKMKARHLKKFCRLDEQCRRLLESAMHKLSLSARAYARILKLSRTIADLDSSGEIRPHHISEAIQYRTLDRGGV